MIKKLRSRLNFTSTLVAATFFLFSTNSFADEKSYFTFLDPRLLEVMLRILGQIHLL